jgi:ABC-type phosphate transport system substrate-binding protein
MTQPDSVASPGSAPPRAPRTAVALLLLAAMLARGSNTAPPIAVIVGRGQAPPTQLSQTLIVGIFARKRQLWDDSSTIVPVNLPATHPLRRDFSLWVFKRTPEDMQDYWNDQYFHGVLPPPVLGSEEAVLRFVASTPGSIGYVSSCSVDKRVDVVALIQSPDGSALCPH